MPTKPSEPLTEWVDAPAESASRLRVNDPGRYLCRWKPFSLATIIVSLVILGGGYLAARGSGVPGIVAFVLICVTIGLMQTMAAMAWGAMISLTESTRCGALFVASPYMFYYAVTRWRWMSQPSVLFLCGVGLAAGSILIGRHLLDQIAPAL